MKRTKIGDLGKREKNEPMNPLPGVWLIQNFGNTGVVETSDGLVLIDVAMPPFMGKTMSMLRSALDAPIHSIFLTHRHLDHAAALDPIYDEAEQNNSAFPRTIAQRNMVRGFNRYRMLHGYHEHINRIQFAMPDNVEAFPLPKRNPDITFDKNLTLQIGGNLFEAFHAKGETDDHLWVWVPEKKTVFTGDMMVSGFPNVGNPFKVQRYTLQWAEGLEAIAGKDPEVLIPGHGNLVQGKDNIQDICLTTANALRYLHDEVVKRLNDGMWYEEILHDIEIPEKLTEPSFLKPMYGRPEFVIHGVLREYTGWYDGNPSNLFPPKRSAINREIVSLLGKDQIITHARKLQQADQLDMALQFIDIALSGDLKEAEENECHQLKAALLNSTGEKDTSLISRNIYHNGYKQEMKLAGLEDQID
ncbi:MAG: MBL fold metallo-hydrolase [Deltaproteobacteria bacterium]|jgi:alkyl sulfatase BDS1-like metallo-beta-lactamase superfamily hydrolase|nr:MBL fold metallo-hydrolase [Deltaproteobacteria bacterium]MBT4639739.1 MBL fold metallo-hydrolase [Deltaproteobacteria bacterium]MBT6500229.1 MBL fold metallo-hydrolase [Deltaproteobacteria bacterium]MBT7716680.1 MBL fold metallo-hydrolase [Deltaproteobacteria bacterium]